MNLNKIANENGPEYFYKNVKIIRANKNLFLG